MALGVLVGGLIVLGLKLFALSFPTIEPEAGQVIGMYTPIKIIFPQEMDKSSVESRISIDPEVAIKKNWTGRELKLDPISAFPAGGEIHLTLKSGSVSLDGRTYDQNLDWVYAIRFARVAYIGTATTAPEVWLVDQDGKNAKRITQTGGNVTGFFPIPDGSGFFYSTRNSLGGSDLHRIDRDGIRDEIVLNCGKEICADPVVSRDGQLLAFSRNQDPEEGTLSSKSYIYTALIEQRPIKPTPLVGEKLIGGILPSFSPDGLKISFYDSGSKGIRVMNQTDGNDFLLGTNRIQLPAWAPEGSKLAFIDDDNSMEDVSSRLYVVDLKSSSIDEPFKDVLKNVELGELDWSTDGRFLAVGVNIVNGGVARQMWVIDILHKTVIKITNDLTRINAAPSWRPDAGALAFQQAQPGVSGAKPAVIVWEEKSREVNLVANDAAMPAWLP